MYNELLNGIYSANNLNNDIAKANYLRSLQEHVRNLRQAYRTYPVHFDYTNRNIQEAYLLTYFPHYTDFLWKTLNFTGNQIANENINELILFGSGPCPEIIGFLRYVNQHNPQNQEIKVSMFDIAIEDWGWTRHIVYNFAVPSYLNGATCRRSIGTFDLRNPFNIAVDDRKKLCVFQNCLNEIEPATHNNLIRSISSLFERLPNDSYLALIDLDYGQVMDLIFSVENQLNNNFQCSIIKSIEDGPINHRTTQGSEPPIMLNNLLTDRFGGTPTGLLPRRNLPFICTLIKKTSEITNTNSDDDLPF